MKRLLSYVLIILGTSIPTLADNVDLKRAYAELDDAIQHIPDYDARHTASIDSLKRFLTLDVYTPAEELACRDKIVQAYSKFVYDSAVVYVDRCIEQGRELGDAPFVWRKLMQKSRFYAAAGSYLEALKTLEEVDTLALPDSLAHLYAQTCADVYGETGHYSPDAHYHQYYGHLAWEWRRRLKALTDTTSTDFLRIKEARARYDGRYDDALALNDEQLRLVGDASTEYALVAYNRSVLFEQMGDAAQRKYWLTRSAISDIRHSIKDQASLWTLAQVLADEGDVERSYRYIRVSQDGLAYFNTPLRHRQSTSVMTVIDHNYTLMTQQQNRQLKGSLLLISLLALLLIGAVVYVFRQNRRLKTARQSLAEANTHLTELNAELSEAVEQLNEANTLLLDSNRIKETYIGRFLTLCSTYMKKMEAFRTAVQKKEKSGQLADFLSATRMRELKEKDVEELMADFDQAFLRIVPTFIDEFNALLKPESRIQPPKDTNRLTTELRIFALIRLGITDSSKIAEFLHYSVNTIYNYRSMVKNEAIGVRDDFEDQVRMIGNPRNQP